MEDNANVELERSARRSNRFLSHCTDVDGHDLVPYLSVCSEPGIEVVRYVCQRRGCNYGVNREERV